MSKHVIADRAGPAMSASPIDASVDALYDELFRCGKHLHDPVPIDPKAIIRKHLAAAALWELLQWSQPPVVQQQARAEARS